MKRLLVRVLATLAFAIQDERVTCGGIDEGDKNGRTTDRLHFDT